MARARARARTPSNSPIHVAQELRERAIRIVKSGGASNVIMAEKALPKCHPNLLLLLSMDALDAVPQAEWGEKKVGLQGRKANALAWTVGSALAPAPLPGVAQLQAKRHCFRSRCTLWLGQAAADAQAAPELRATVEAMRTSEVEGLRLDLRDALVRIATLEDVLGKLPGRLVP